MSALWMSDGCVGADAVVGCEFDVGFDGSGPYVVGFGTAVKFI